MSCATCYEARLSACPSSIQLVAGLTPSTTYYWILTTPRDKVYQRQATSDATGKLTIDTSLLPAGLCNQHAGAFNLEIRQGANYLTVVPLTIKGVQYECVQIVFQEHDDEPTNPYNIIQ